MALLSSSARRQWDVYVDDVFVCTTPCKRLLDPEQPITLHERRDIPVFETGELVGYDIKVPHLFPAAREGAVALQVPLPNDSLRLAGFHSIVWGVLPLIMGLVATPAACKSLLPGGSQEPCALAAGITTVGTLLTGGGLVLWAAGAPRPVVLTTAQYLESASH